MMNIKIYKDILEAEYDIDVLYMDISTPNFVRDEHGYSCKQSCYMLTSDGELEIYLTSKRKRENSKLVFNGDFESKLRTITNERLEMTIKNQIEVEKFLQ